MAPQVLSASFLKTATRREEWPAGAGPEFALAGRSNVGKSSLLNALVRRGKLAWVSSTPGRTRQLQFFEVVERPSPAAPPQTLRFCDLPGYGYARVSKAERERWGPMIEEYLRGRGELRAVVLIVDGRRPPGGADREALAFLEASGREVVVAATKLDKLSKSRRSPAVRAVEDALGLPPGGAVPFSAVEGRGVDALWARLLPLARAASGVVSGS